MHLRIRGFSALICAAALSGCVWLSGNREAIHDVDAAPFARAGTLEQIDERIRRAAQMQGWEVEEIQPQILYATKRRGQHAATIAIRYDAASFSIRLRASENLKQDDSRIHKLYNEWVRELESTIQREVDSGA